MKELSPEPLLAGSQPALGATHEENAGLGEARDLGPADVEQMFGPAETPLERLRAAGMVDENQVEMGGGGDEDMKLMRSWRKEQILRGAGDLDNELRRIKDRIDKGEVLSKTDTFRLRDGSTVEGTLGDRLQGLLLARTIWYPTPKEAAMGLRQYEGIVRKEIDDYQIFDGGMGASRRPLIAGLNRTGGVPYTEGDYFLKLSEIQKLIENPPELQEFRRTLEALINEYGNEYLRRMAQRFRRHELVGLMPDIKDLPLFVPFDQAVEEIRRRAPDGKDVDQEAYRLYLEEADAMKRAEMAKAMGLGVSQEAMGGEYYIGMYQKAWDEFCEALNTFPPDVQDEIIANYIIGGSMLGGQYPAFYRKGVEQRGRFPSKWTPWLNAIEHFQKVSGIEGYIPPEQIFQALGSVKPEVLAFPDFHTSKHELWFAGEDKPRKFSISSRDMIGQLGKIDTLARLGANNAYEGGTGFFAVRNGEFAEYLFRQMGYSPDMARKIAYEKAEAPTLIRDSRLSPTRRREITNIWDWVGETALDKLIVAMAWIKYTRADLEFLPLDVKRRAILSLRGLELSHYRVGYSIGLPPEQFLNMIALFGSAISLDHKEMLFWITKRLNPDAKKDIEKSGGTEEQKTRERVWRDTITLERPSLASSRHLARMAMGAGKYNKNGDDYRATLKDGMRKLPSGYIEAVRHPDLWKWRWFKNADQDPSAWRYIGNIGGGISEQQMGQAFAGHDFTKELEACGLSENEISDLQKKSQTKGYAGWKSLLANATLGLLKWEDIGYTTGDKVWRYEKKKEATQDATIAFLETSNPNVPDSLDDMLKINPDIGELADIPGKAATYQRTRRKTAGLDDDLFVAGGVTQSITEAFSKILEPISGSLGFVLNSTQQAYLESVIWMYMEGHCAQRLDVLVEDIDIKPDKLVGGVNWSVPVLMREDMKEFPDRVEALKGEGFYFVHIQGTEASKDVLVSPLAAPVPKLIQAGNLLKKISDNLERANNGMKDHAAHILDAIELMRREDAFCWDTLINGRADIPPATIVSAINDVKEEGAMTASGKRAICNEALRFYKIHPDGTSAISDKTTRAFVPKLIK